VKGLRAGVVKLQLAGFMAASLAALSASSFPRMPVWDLTFLLACVYSPFFRMMHATQTLRQMAARKHHI
jgi:hypothetical protein